MSKLAIFLIVLGAWFSGLTKISRTNELKQQAEAAYYNKQYAVAAAAWSEIIQASANPDPAVRLNLAHALRLQGQKVKAAREYQQVVRTGAPELQSIAQLQLGNMLAQAQEFEEALKVYKAAIKANAGNNMARYNYELIKKYLDQQKEEEEQPEEEPEEVKQDQQKQQQSQSQAQQNPGGNGQPGQPQPGSGNNQRPVPQGNAGGDELGQSRNSSDSTNNQPPNLPPQTRQEGNMPGQETSMHRLEQIRMTEERARALLNAMRSAELQYLQQLPRQQTTKPAPGKPDW